MSKAIQYLCDACGHTFSKWSGQCPECSAWNTLEEQRALRSVSTRKTTLTPVNSQIIPLSDVNVEQQARVQTGLSELDRVLGGGIVRGSVVLLGGSPGIGKSTLLLQMLAALEHLPTLYISGE